MSNAARKSDNDIIGAIVYGTVFDHIPFRVQGIVIETNKEGFTVLWDKKEVHPSICQCTYLYDKINPEEPWDLDDLPIG